MISPYSVLKTHFDRLMTQPLSNTGLEPIRDVYGIGFNKKINLYDIYQTPIKNPNNPVSAIISLVGPDDETEEIFPDGIMVCNGSIVSVNTIPEQVVSYGINENNINSYIEDVYDAMLNVVAMDSFYGINGLNNTVNPYITFIKCAPFYFMYHHIKELGVENDKYLINLLEKYIVANDDKSKVFESIKRNKYTQDPNEIFYIMTAGRTIDLNSKF